MLVTIAWIYLTIDGAIALIKALAKLNDNEVDPGLLHLLEAILFGLLAHAVWTVA